MPFTISHLAAAKPLDRLLGQQLPLVALAVGTMVPDLEFFLRGRIERTIGHTAHGAVLMGVPLGLAFLAVLSWLIIPAIRALLPAGADHFGAALERSMATSGGSWLDPLSLARIVLALLIGAGSHIVWDVFTQPAATDTAATVYGSLAWLDRFQFSIGDANFALHSLLHWLSTAAGLIAVMVAADRWIERNPAPTEASESDRSVPSITRRIGLTLTGATTVGFLVQHPVALLGDGPARPSGLSSVLATEAVWALAGCFVGLAAFGALLRFGALPTEVTALARPPDPTRPADLQPVRDPAAKVEPPGPRSPKTQR
ncbi:MAG: DUF4184 family protein [Acidimicrobiales bacterium]